MLIGNPDKFAFWVEKVPEWCSNGFVNGLLYVFVNGEMFPKELRTTTLSTDLHMVFDYAFTAPPLDKRLYALSDEELFGELRRLRWPEWFGCEDDDDDYRFDIELQELGDCRYDLFAVSGGERVRVLIGHWVDKENFVFANSAELTLDEFKGLRNALSEYYQKEIRQA